MNTKTTIVTIMLAFIGLSSSFAQVGIGTKTPHPSSILDLTATDKGFLPPRMTTAQRDAISNPAEGLTIYNTTANCLQWFIGNAWHDGCGDNLYLQYPPGTNFCNFKPTEIVDVVFAGYTWMDRNLGANRAAQSIDDAQSYGYLYQWGRASDGHQCVHRYVGDGVTTSGSTTTLATTDTPSHGLQILNGILPSDWRNPQNNNLWQGVNGINNPCPSGYRVPTETEISAVRTAFSNSNITAAFATALKISASGHRNTESNTVNGEGYSCDWWSSTVSTTYTRRLNIDPFGSSWGSQARGWSYSVRCIKN